MTNAVSANRGHQPADQPFLLSKTPGCPQGNISPSASASAETPPDDPLLREFPGIQSGRAFIALAGGLLKDTARFSALALRLDSTTGREPALAPEKLFAYRCEAARTVAQVADEEGAFWGLISSATLGCVLPGRDQASGVAVAKKIQSQLSAIDGHSLTIGIAAFPCLRYGPADIIHNAGKALAHATFFGPGGRACFDAVSLNISGDCYYDAGEIENAIAEYRNALRLDARNVNVLNSLGVCFGVRQEYDKALTAFSAAAKIEPQEVLALYNAGLVHLLRDEMQTALKFWLQAAPQGRDIFELNFQIARCLLETDQAEKAQAYIQRAADLRPESAPAQRLLGDIFLALRLTDQAIAPYKSALRINPNDAAALSGLARCYELRNENMEIALSFCQQSVEIAPDNGRSFLRLGRLLQKSARLEDALEAFKRAEALGEDARGLIMSVEERLIEKAS
ncbi:MAG: tetratricopeptide repeat protein [Desulfobacterales bacterium]|nr:tetratricopeptide repeat protein [Desulfobacterales bacterium]MDJ0876090.1 tetratricopeptide repeat protein [Desulfobacterales bacterium]MDJ0882777.1 tetratricopeptide repeat protein [Desulfobacterales bacterium]